MWIFLKNCIRNFYGKIETDTSTNHHRNAHCHCHRSRFLQGTVDPIGRASICIPSDCIRRNALRPWHWRHRRRPCRCPWISCQANRPILPGIHHLRCGIRPVVRSLPLQEATDRSSRDLRTVCSGRCHQPDFEQHQLKHPLR